VIAYRDATPEDAGPLASLARETFDEAFGYLYAPEDLAAFFKQAKTPEALARWIADPRGRVRIAEADGRMIGYCIVGLRSKLDHRIEGRRVVDLDQLYIRASHHGAGVAQQLMAWAMEQAEAENADDLVLSVYSGNERGMAFYRKLGFTYLRDATFTVGKQVDAEYLYVKSLKE
jgi:diamine N-acetyltransferase